MWTVESSASENGGSATAQWESCGRLCRPPACVPRTRVYYEMPVALRAVVPRPRAADVLYGGVHEVGVHRHALPHGDEVPG